MIQQNKVMKLLIILIFILSFAPIVASAAPFAYITNYGSNTVSVIDTSSNTVTATVTVGTGHYGVAVNPAGTRVYVANVNSNTVSVIDTSSNTVTATVTVESMPFAFGIFISPGGASDTTAPGITISTPQEGKSYSTSTIALNVTADESIVTWQYSINGTANVTFTPNITLPGLPDGNHNVTVYANDSAGNIGSALVNFSIDTTAPKVTIDAPTPSVPIHIAGGEQFWVNFTYTELYPANYTVTVGNATAVINSITTTSVAGGTGMTANESFALNTSAADGLYNVTVEMYDNSSNYNITHQNNSVKKGSYGAAISRPENQTTEPGANATYELKVEFGMKVGH